MFSVANVEKFLQDNAHRISVRKAVHVLKRARECAGEDGAISGGDIEPLWADTQLAQEFTLAINNDAGHVQIGRAALKGPTED